MTQEFGSGFSKSNLEYMRRFFLMYRTRIPLIAQKSSGQSSLERIPQTISGQSRGTRKFRTLSGKSDASAISQKSSAEFTLGWSHYVFLLGVKDPDERSFYEIESSREGWTLETLKRQYDSGLYERLALSRDKRGIRRLAREGQTVPKPEDILKEPLVLEFLGLDASERYSESDLESAIIGRIEQFLLELGKGFLFEARQRRFTFDGEHFFVDLVFYNRLLKCYVLFDLKLGRLTHQDLGQMQMYVNYFDRKIRRPDEASTVGIILCKQKNKALVEITLPKGAHIHAGEYQLYLPSKAELRRKLIEWTKGT